MLKADRIHVNSDPCHSFRLHQAKASSLAEHACTRALTSGIHPSCRSLTPCKCFLSLAALHISRVLLPVLRTTWETRQNVAARLTYASRAFLRSGVDRK